MTDSPPTPTPAVLGDVMRDGLGLLVSCRACGHAARLDPAVLAGRLGYDFAVPDLAARLRCSRCAGREIEIRLNRAGEGPVARHG